MKKIVITREFAGMRLDKYLKRHFPSAQSPFLYRMLRKKNITLNGKKASGGEHIKEADEIAVFFSDETYAKMRSDTEMAAGVLALSGITERPAIIFEDADILLVNKPAGQLSQKGRPEDISLNEVILGYLIRNGELDESKFNSFRPSVMNRLDRNTSGIVAAAKTYAGSRFLADGLRSHAIRKEYEALVIGDCELSGLLRAYLIKDEANNISRITDKEEPQAKAIAMRIVSACPFRGYTLLTIELLTGRSHQIRAWLSHLGHPIVGDAKYGGNKKGAIQAERQLLHARRLILPEGTAYVADYPEDFRMALAALEDR